MVSSKLVLDFTDQVVSPLDHHVLGHGLVVRVLDGDQVLELSGELEGGFVGVHEALLLEVDALLDEDSGHGHQVLVGAEVLALDFVILHVEVVLARLYHGTPLP